MTALSEIPIGVRRLPHGEGLELPRYHSALAAGMDLRAAVPEHAPRILRPGERALIPTGITIALPPGHEGQIRPRSGLALHHGVTVLNAPGTIDADYRGELQALLINLGEADFTITRGMRIAQLVVASVARGTWRDLTDAEAEAQARGTGGFGSTGLGVATRGEAACNERVAGWRSHPPLSPASPTARAARLWRNKLPSRLTLPPVKTACLSCRGRQVIPKKAGSFRLQRQRAFRHIAARGRSKTGGWAGKCKGGVGGVSPPNRLALQCTMSGGRAKDMGGVPPSARRRGGALWPRASAPRTCQRQNAFAPHMQENATHESGASFVQRTPNDSEKRASISANAASPLGIKPCQMALQKGRVGGQKHGGAWGGLPPKIDSHFRAQMSGGRAKRKGGLGGLPPKSTRTSMHNVGWAGKMIGGCGGIFPPHAKHPPQGKRVSSTQNPAGWHGQKERVTQHEKDDAII